MSDEKEEQIYQATTFITIKCRSTIRLTSDGMGVKSEVNPFYQSYTDIWYERDQPRLSDEMKKLAGELLTMATMRSVAKDVPTPKGVLEVEHVDVPPKENIN